MDIVFEDQSKVDWNMEDNGFLPIFEDKKGTQSRDEFQDLQA